MLYRKMTYLILGASFTALATCASGCSLLVNTEDKQCKVDGDCAALGFEGTYCGDGGVCLNTLGYCSTNRQCIERNGSESYICRQDTHACVALTSKDCPKLLADPGDMLDDSTIVIGTMGMPSVNTTLSAGENAVELARQDFRNLIPAATPGSGARPIAVVACDVSLTNDISHKAASDHLIDNVNVPAIIGPLSSFHVLYALNKAMTKRNPVIFTSSQVASTQFTDLPGRVGIFYRNAYTAKTLLASEAKLVSATIEPRIRAAGVERPIKVAIAKGGSGAGSSLTSEFTDLVRFNGKTALDNGDNYREFTWGDISAPGLDARVAAAAVDAANWKPDVVLVKGADETIDFTLQLERSLPGQVNYLLNSQATQKRLSDGVGADESFRSRIWISVGGRSVKDRNLAVYLNRHTSAYPDDEPAGETSTSAGNFDAFYMLAFAIAANGANPVNGENLGKMLQTRLQGGTPIQMGPADNLLALNILANGGNIEYNGAFSTSRFDEKGDIGVDVQYWCVSSDTTQSFRFGETGLSYEASSAAIVGSNSCF